MKLLPFFIFFLTGCEVRIKASSEEQLKCVTVEHRTYRCENSEVICYESLNSGLQCKWKTNSASKNNDSEINVQ